MQLHQPNVAVISSSCDVTNLQKLILCGIREPFIKCVLQRLGNESHAISAGEHNQSNIQRLTPVFPIEFCICNIYLNVALV